jgi:hypothetical protein
MNAIDSLRSIALVRRRGIPDDRLQEALGLEPAAYDFACALVLALTADGRLDDFVGPLPDQELPT